MSNMEDEFNEYADYLKGREGMEEYLDSLDHQWSPTGGVSPIPKVGTTNDLKHLHPSIRKRAEEKLKESKRFKNPSTRRLDAIE